MTLNILQRKPVADTQQHYFFLLAAKALSYVLSHIPVFVIPVMEHWLEREPKIIEHWT